MAADITIAAGAKGVAFGARRKKFTFREVREARKEKQKPTMHAQDAKKILLVAVAMNNGIFALARIKIAPYGNLVGNCRDMMPHDRRQDKGT